MFGILSRNESALEKNQFPIIEGIIIPRGIIARQHHMAQRTQYFTHLCEKLNLTLAELVEYLLDNSITNAEHASMAGEASLPKADQLSLFEP